MNKLIIIANNTNKLVNECLSYLKVTYYKNQFDCENKQLSQNDTKHLVKNDVQLADL